MESFLIVPFILQERRPDLVLCRSGLSFGLRVYTLYSLRTLYSLQIHNLPAKKCHEHHDDKQYRAKIRANMRCSRMGLEERGLKIGTKRRYESSCGETSIE